jgi:sugar phosphate isomerase/epimerase
MTFPPLAVAMIVFGQEFQRVPETVLAAVQASGFEAIECGTNAHAADAQAFRALLDRYGLKVAGLHGGLIQDLDPVFRLMECYDTRDLCVSGIGGWEGIDPERYLRETEALNAMGRACAQHGYALHYHNHAYEFAPTAKGLSGMDLILRALDPEVADLCVDVAWVTIAGLDAASFLREHGALVGYVHLKDYFGKRHWVELGQGVVPLPSVMLALDELPRVRWAAYEQDVSARSADESCAISHEYLVDYFGYR